MTRSDEIFSQLSSLSYVEAEVAAGRVFALVREYAWALREVPLDHARYEVLAILAAGLRENAAFLTKCPAAVFQCFWNSCWWHDCVERRAFRLSCLHQGPVSRLMEKWRAEKGKTVWLRSLRPPAVAVKPALRLRSCIDCDKYSLTLHFSGEVLFAWSGGTLQGAWDVTSGAPVDMTFPDPCLSKEMVVSGEGWGATVCVTDAAGKEVWQFSADEDDSLNYFAFSGDGHVLAAVGIDIDCGGPVYVWDLGSGRLLRRFYSGSPLYAVAVSADGSEVLTGSSRGQVVVWDVASGKVCRELPRHDNGVTAVAFSTDRNLAAVAGVDGTIRVWNLMDPTPSEKVAGGDDHIKEIKFSPSGRRLVTRTANGTTWLWNGGNGEPIAELAENNRVVLVGGDAKHCLFAGEREIRSTASNRGRWASEDGERIDDGREFRGTGRLLSSPDGLHFVTGGKVGDEIRLFIFEGGTGLRWDLQMREASVVAAEFSPDGAYFVLVSGAGDVGVWNVARKTSRCHTVEPPGERGVTCAVSFDGEMTAVATSQGPIRVFGGGIDVALAGTETRELRFFEGDRIAALDEQDFAEIWNYRTGETVGAFEWCGSMQNFSPDVEYSTRMRDGEFQVMDARTGAEVASLPCPGSLSMEASVGRDGRWTWAGHNVRNLYHFALEGRESVI